MGISFNSGGSGTASSGASTVTTLSVSGLTCPAGSWVVVFLGTNNTISSQTIVDNNSNPLTALSAQQPSVSGFAYVYQVPSTGATGFTANWTTARASSMVVLNYTGATRAVGQTGGTGTSTAPSVSNSAALRDTGSYFVGTMIFASASVTLGTFTGTGGTVTQRKQLNTGSDRQTAGDVSSLTSLGAGTVQLSGTLSSSATWVGVAVELVGSVSNSLMMMGVGT
ncbi:MAG: hypothetical protein C5B59_08515 [Bacteroidetes bacterium]|nr:MAG: hypothetical protein C5B59_08515 [Bacteroidota bacterium]